MSAPPDPGRRRFFRQFAGEVVTSAAQLAGVVTELRDRSAAEAQLLLADPVAAPGPPAAPTPTRTVDGPIANPTGFRTPFRFEGDTTLMVIDQRLLPDQLLEIPVRTAYDGARVIRDMAVRGAPAIGQVAAISLALSAALARNAPPRSRDHLVNRAAASLRAARPTAVNLVWAVDRLMAVYEAQVATGAFGPAIAAAMREEADRIVAEATDDHGALADHGAAILPAVDGRPLELLTHCNTGPLACGQFGTALGVVQAVHAADRPVHVWVDETRPYLQGARLTAWELAQAGVPHTVIPDGAAAGALAAGRVDAVLVGADRVAANGDTANKVGTYPLAVLAARHGVPFYVCAPLSSVDLATPDGSAIPIEERPAREVTEVRGTRITPPGTDVWNPAFDVTPAELITGIVTEEGVLRSPYGPSLAAAVRARAARRPLATPSRDPASPPSVPEPTA